MGANEKITQKLDRSTANLKAWASIIDYLSDMKKKMEDEYIRRIKKGETFKYDEISILIREVFFELGGMLSREHEEISIIKQLLGHPTPLEYWKDILDNEVDVRELDLTTEEGIGKLYRTCLGYTTITPHNEDGTVTANIPSGDGLMNFIKQYLDSRNTNHKNSIFI